MKKVLILFTLVLSLFALTACSGTEVADLEAELATAEAALAAAEGDITALEADVAAAEAALAATVLPTIPTTLVLADANFDDFLGRPDVQYVDLRNFDEKLKSGYVQGFESIPYFQYLAAAEILTKNADNWTFAAANLKDANALKELFDMDKAIFLMCGSGTRAEYVLEALESLGYENVYNVGGFADYSGDAKVLGDGSFAIDFDTQTVGSFTPGTYFGNDPVGGYMATVIINEKGGIGSVTFDAVQGMTTKQNLGDAYGMKNRGATYEWYEHANMLSDYIVENQGWGVIELTETAFSALWTALSVPHHIIEFDADNNPDDVAGVTIGAEGFVLAWNDAIGQASTTDLGVVAIDITPEQWAAAHEPAFEYVDGVYFGLDEAHGYSAKVTIVDSTIVDVFFDAITPSKDFLLEYFS